MKHPPRILVAGIGNIFLGDDAFGSEVARRLLARPQPPNVHVIDFGIRGLDLTYALLDGCDAAILIDAAPRRAAAPGTLYVIEPEAGPASGAASPMIDGHSMNPFRVLQTVRSLGGRCARVLLVGCEPTPPAEDAPSDDVPMEMTPPVRAAVEEAVGVVESLVQRINQAGDRPLNYFAPPGGPPPATYQET